jgi:hypothetical protein
LRHLQFQRAVATAGYARQGEEGLRGFRRLELVFGGDYDSPSGVYIEDSGTFFGQQTIQPLNRDDEYLTWSAAAVPMNDATMLYVTAATGTSRAV